MIYLTFQTHLCSLLACRGQVLALCLLEHLAKEQGKADTAGRTQLIEPIIHFIDKNKPTIFILEGKSRANEA